MPEPALLTRLHDVRLGRVEGVADDEVLTTCRGRWNIKVASGSAFAFNDEVSRGDVMSTLEIARAWVDQEYRGSLSVEQIAELPEHPAGAIDAELEQLLDMWGGQEPSYTAGCTGTCSCTASQYSSHPCCC